ncbi:hypothetical protein, partial [Pseudomonas syringae group genomosp. 7]|uniref:hypothetical protein n=1 Tax=Pseudomonas syringae group genomosp. 7 TaxID=251699 RepID=UPI00376F5539
MGWLGFVCGWWWGGCLCVCWWLWGVVRRGWVCFGFFGCGGCCVFCCVVFCFLVCVCCVGLCCWWWLVCCFGGVGVWWVLLLWSLWVFFGVVFWGGGCGGGCWVLFRQSGGL